MHNQFKPGDWSELKRLAEAAVEARPDRQHPTFGYAKAMSQLHEKASPEAILALIAENERMQPERDQLRAEVEALRKDTDRNPMRGSQEPPFRNPPPQAPGVSR